MRRCQAARVASVGVTETRRAIEKNLDWLFREQPTEDYGIDAHVEVVDGEMVRGRLLALQVKSGESWFRAKTPGGWWYRPDNNHVTYWLNHSLPVVVVLYHPHVERCYWQLVNRASLIGTAAGGWKILVPEAQVLDQSAVAPLRAAAEGDPYVLRIRELQLARSWMTMLASGRRLVIDIAEWVNKTSGRGTIRLGVDNEDGRGPSELASWGVFLGLSTYGEVVPTLFAWADVRLHEETYDDADHDLYETEAVVYDEGDRIATADYAGWQRERLPEGLRPYALGSELASWRLELHLNDLGRSFMVVDEFATHGGRNCQCERASTDCQGWWAATGGTIKRCRRDDNGGRYPSSGCASCDAVYDPYGLADIVDEVKDRDDVARLLVITRASRTVAEWAILFDVAKASGFDEMRVPTSVQPRGIDPHCARPTRWASEALGPSGPGPGRTGPTAWSPGAVA